MRSNVQLSQCGRYREWHSRLAVNARFVPVIQLYTLVKEIYQVLLNLVLLLYMQALLLLLSYLGISWNAVVEVNQTCIPWGGVLQAAFKNHKENVNM